MTNKLTRRPGPGRPAGSQNKITLEVRDLARDYGPQAIERLAMLGGLLGEERAAISHSVQIEALRELLDRAYGKPKVHLDAGNGPLVVQTIERVILNHTPPPSGDDAISVDYRHLGTPPGAANGVGGPDDH